MTSTSTLLFRITGRVGDLVATVNELTTLVEDLEAENKALRNKPPTVLGRFPVEVGDLVAIEGYGQIIDDITKMGQRCTGRVATFTPIGDKEAFKIVAVHGDFADVVLTKLPESYGWRVHVSSITACTTPKNRV